MSVQTYFPCCPAFLEECAFVLWFCPRWVFLPEPHQGSLSLLGRASPLAAPGTGPGRWAAGGPAPPHDTRFLRATPDSWRQGRTHNCIHTRPYSLTHAYYTCARVWPYPHAHTHTNTHTRHTRTHGVSTAVGWAGLVAGWRRLVLVPALEGRRAPPEGGGLLQMCLSGALRKSPSAAAPVKREA